MQTHLKDADKELIADAVRTAELRTNGEIVTVLARQSDHYTATAVTLALILSFGAACITYFLRPAFNFTTMSIIELTFFFLLLTIFELTGMHSCAVPMTHKIKAVRRLAGEQFLASKLHISPLHASIMILISSRERWVELVADHGIAICVEPRVWEDITRRLRQDLRAKPLAVALKTAVEECGIILATHFPPFRRGE